MNERIKELSKQAWAWAEQQEYKDATQEFSDILEQKFAELIILECAEVSFKHWEQHKGCSAHFSIREHFGVEG